MTTSRRASHASWISDRLHPILRGNGGVAAVEFALLLPLIMTLLLGIIDWGYYFYLSETVVNAAREGARTGIVQSTGSVAATTAQSTAQTYLTGGGITLGSGDNEATVALPTTPSTGGNLAVNVSIATFKSLSGFLAAPLIPTSITYTSTMRWEF